MLAALRQTANEYFNLRSGLVERKEDAFASEWRSRYEQLRRAEEAIFDGTSAPNRATEQLIASKPPNMQGLHFEYALQHLLPKFVFSRKSKSQKILEECRRPSHRQRLAYMLLLADIWKKKRL